MTENTKEEAIQVQYNSHLIIPLKAPGTINLSKLDRQIRNSFFYKKKKKERRFFNLLRSDGGCAANADSSKSKISYTKNSNRVTLYDLDLNEHIYTLFNEGAVNQIASVYVADHNDITDKLYNSRSFSLYLTKPANPTDIEADFSIDKVYLYVFNTGVAFICLSINYKDIAVMREIYDPAFARLVNTKSFFCSTNKDNFEVFCFKDYIDSILKNINKTKLQFFYPVEKDTVFSESYIANIAVIPNRISSSEQIKKMAYCLSRMHSPYSEGFQSSLYEGNDIFTLPKLSKDSYQWCTCVGDSCLARVRGEDTLERQIRDFRNNSLTLILLALYQKYSCLHFGNLLRKNVSEKTKSFSTLQNALIDFKAFGVISAGSISKVDIIRKYYTQLLTTFGVTDVLGEIDTKLSVISEHEKDKNESKINSITLILAILSIVSISADMDTIVKSIFDENVSTWNIIIITVAAIIVLLIISLIINLIRNRR